MNARAVDVPRTAKGLFAAALRTERRSAAIVVATKEPSRTTAEAKRMGITGLVGGYTTIYTGDPNRVHNVRLVANLIDHTLIKPGQVFSFNGTTGERNAAKGFLEAPVIINGELQTGLGGGVCQVSTTVFNAAYEAGLDITERTNHALYISHYPQGRDATVNYPDTDLKFVNDTGRWLLLRTFVGSSSLTVDLYGAPQNRRVESEVAPLEVVGKPPTTWRKDPTITKGRRVIADAGSSPLTTSVRRKVYDASGTLLYDDVWYSSYRGEKKIVLVGTKPKPEPKPKPKPKEKPAAGDEASACCRARASPRARAQPLSLRFGDCLGQPGGKAGRTQRRRVDDGMPCPAVCDERPVARDGVLVTKARAADVAAARVDRERVVEPNGLEIADVRLDRQRLVALLLDAPVAVRVAGEIRDARHLEPHEVDGVVRDSLRVGLREADRDLRPEVEALHRCVLSRPWRWRALPSSSANVSRASSSQAQA